MALSPAMDAALQGPVVTPFCAVKIELPNGTVRLIDGSGTVTFGSETYTGLDSVYGTLSAIEQINEEVATSAPRAKITLMPPDNAAIVALTDPMVQGSPVTIWVGVVDSSTGAVTGTPEALFVGEIDTAILVIPSNNRFLELDIASVWERLFADSEGARLNGFFHKTVYPGELGFDFVIEAKDDPYWGSDGPKPAATATSSGSGVGFRGLALPDDFASIR